MPSQFLSSSSVHLEAGITFGGTATARWTEVQMQQGGNEHFLWDLSTLSVTSTMDQLLVKLQSRNLLQILFWFEKFFYDFHNYFRGCFCCCELFREQLFLLHREKFRDKCKFSGRFRLSHVSKLVVLLWNWLFEKCWDTPSCSSEMLINQDHSFSMSFYYWLLFISTILKRKPRFKLAELILFW